MKSNFFSAVNIGNLPDYYLRQGNVKKIKLFDVVALTHDLPEHNLWRGQVGTVVEILSNGDAYEVEFSDRDGRTYQSPRVSCTATNGPSPRTNAKTTNPY